MKEPVTLGVTTCVEICGDGYNYGQYDCDDGNLVSGDGCNSKCRIEAGYNCTGGGALSPDTCIDVKNPTPSISLINSKNYIYIEFDEEVKLFGDLTSQQLQVVISGG